MTGRFPAWRAAFRLARRDAWRNKGRSALVALMIALPVLALSTVSVLYRSDERDPQDNVRVRLGAQAQAEITLGYGVPIAQTPDADEVGSLGSDPEKPPAETHLEKKLAALIPARDRIQPDRSVESNHNLLLGDRMIGATLREVDYTADGLGGLLDQAAGRAPQQAGEVVVSQKLLDAGVHVGDRLTYQATSADPEKDLTVVGVVDGYDLEGTKQLIGLPGTLLPAAAFTGELNPSYGGAWTNTRLLVVGPDPVTWDDVLDLNQLGATVLSRSVVAHPPSSDRVPYNRGSYTAGPGSQAVGIVVVVIGLILLQIALLAGPAIAVGARRNQRTLALLASAGAERRHLRTLVLATNGVIALVSCVFAALAGTVVGIAVIAVLRARGAVIVRIDVHPLDLLVLIAAGLATAIGASLVPARQAAKLDVVAALTGRRGYSPPALRVPLLGLLLAVGGTALALVSSTNRWEFATVLGLAVTEIGLVMASGAVVALTARLAVRLPFSARFALRDAARQRSRTAPAVAAVLAAIAGGSAALVYVAAQDDHDQRQYRPSAAAGVIAIGVDSYSFDDAVQSLPKAEQVLRKELPINRIQSFRTMQTDVDGGRSSLSLTPLLAPGTICPGSVYQGGISIDTTGSVPATTDSAPAQAGDPGPCEGPVAAGSIDFFQGLLFDDGTAVQALTRGAAPASAAALKAGKVVTTDPEVIWPDGAVHVTIDRWQANGEEVPPSSAVALPAVLAPPGDLRLNGMVYPLTAAAKLGVSLKQGGLIATPATLPSQDTEDRVNGLLRREAGVQMDVERGYVSQYGLGLLALLIAAAVISLVGTFTAVGLAAAETRADVSTLAAVGAGPGVRRRLAAAQAGVISGLGGVLGVGSGILAGWVLIRMQQDWDVSYGAPNLWRLVLPWPYLFAVGLGIPLLAMTIGFLTTRSRLTVVRRLGQ